MQIQAASASTSSSCIIYMYRCIYTSYDADTGSQREHLFLLHAKLLPVRRLHHLRLRILFLDRARALAAAPVYIHPDVYIP